MCVVILLSLIAVGCAASGPTAAVDPGGEEEPVPSTSAAIGAAVVAEAMERAPDEPTGATVYGDAEFDVRVTTDVVYAQALSHETWGSAAAETVDLLLDVYEPVRDDDAVMPAVVVIHGGGFVGGSKEHGALSDMAYWFAERGWVAYSINYRLAGDVGTLPADYPEPPVAATAKQAEQWRALYPACRDAKAAIRWVHATADAYSVDPERLAVVGGSAGSNLALTLGISGEADCRDEVTIDEDPTLASTNLDQSSEVATVIDHWGGTAILTLLTFMDGVDRFDSSDAPVSIVHGTADATVPFSEAELLRDAYGSTGVTNEWNPLDGAGHGPWRATIAGQSLVESAADFIVETQELERE